MTIRLKTGDMVKVIRGKDAGKSGKITQVLRREGLIVVDGINKMMKHLRSPRKGEKGQRIEFFGPIPASKVMFVCPKCNRPTRLRVRMNVGDDGATTKSRACVKCTEVFA